MKRFESLTADEVISILEKKEDDFFIISKSTTGEMSGVDGSDWVDCNVNNSAVFMDGLLAQIWRDGFNRQSPDGYWMVVHAVMYALHGNVKFKIADHDNYYVKLEFARNTK